MIGSEHRLDHRQPALASHAARVAVADSVIRVQTPMKNAVT
jgi:hypothetical protein|tara:strand:+ start:6115 stop:6237 length:123 start_codon:yes stop_codon:yes gene_type:complete